MPYYLEDEMMFREAQGLKNESCVPREEDDEVDENALEMARLAALIVQ